MPAKIHLINLQKLALSLSIVLVLNLLFNVAVSVVYSSPQYDTFCREEHRKYYDSAEACKAVGGEWGAYIDAPYYPRAVPAKIAQDTGGENDEPKEYCNPSSACKKAYDTAQSLYNRNVFIVFVILGAASLIFSIFAIKVTAVSSGFLFGGLISIFIGTTRYWSNMNEYLRLVVLIIALTALIWVGYKKLRDK